MAAVIGYYVHTETIVIAGKTFHGFEFAFGHSDWMLVKYLQPPDSIIDEFAPLEMLDIPISIPQTIPSGTQIDTGFTAPSDLTFAFLRANTFHEAAKPSAPILADVIISQAFMESCVLYYVEGDVVAGMELPGDNAPDDYEPDENGWYYPPYSDFDFQKITVAQRSVDFQTAGLRWLFNWIYNGCSDMDEDYHIVLTLDEATFNIGGDYTWNTANYINCCNAGTSSGYLIEAGSSGGSSWVDVWIFAPETDKARYYNPVLLQAPDYLDMAPIFEGAIMIFSALFSVSETGLIRLRPGNFGAGKQQYILGDTTVGILGDTTVGIPGDDFR